MAACRCNKVSVDWEVASDEHLKTVVAKGSALARPELGHSVHVEVAGLQPGRPYWYRFAIGRERSVAGRAKTLPAAHNAPDRFRLGVCGCQNYEDGWFTAYRHLAREDVDAGLPLWRLYLRSARHPRADER